MIHRFFLLVYLILLTTFLSGQVHFRVEGKASDISRDGEKVYLVLVENDNERTDSTTIANGMFVFEGEQSEKCFAAVVGASLKWQTAFIILENGAINVDITNELPVIGGTPLNEKLNSGQQKLNSLMKERTAVIDSKGGASRTEAEENHKKTEEIIKNIIYENSDNMIPALYLRIYRDFFTQREIDEAIEKASPALLANGLMQHIVNSNVGRPFVDVKLKDSNNDDVSLSNCIEKGKYILLYCWAVSKPWLRDIPAKVNDICTPFESENFKAIGISLDYDMKLWQKSPQIVNSCREQLWGGSHFMNAYSIEIGPRLFLLNPNGIIIERDFQLKDLEKTLRENILF